MTTRRMISFQRSRWTFFLVALSLSYSGCGSNEEGKNDSTSAESSTGATTNSNSSGATGGLDGGGSGDASGGTGNGGDNSGTSGGSGGTDDAGSTGAVDGSGGSGDSGGSGGSGDGGGSGGTAVVVPEDGDHSLSGIEFSHKRGIYEEPFELTLNHPSATELIYTLDASDPLSSPTAITVTVPANITIDPADTTNRYLAPGVVLRAAPVMSEATLAQVSTHTYLFLNRVVELSPDGQSPGGAWPETQTGMGQAIDYGMDPDIVESNDYSGDIGLALSDLPAVSLVTDLDNLFDPSFGIFMNAKMKGVDEDPSDFEKNWERPGSLEILSEDGSQSLQAGCGIRIRGGYSRNDPNPKHAFKLYFRETYGTSKLFYPLFGSEGVSEFDRLDFRTSGNYSWSFESDSDNRSKNTMNRDVFSRDLQRELSQPYTRSRYYHLFLDGVYWGLFQSQERAEAAFAKSYFGGSKGDFDVIKANKITDDEIEIEFVDGDELSWREVWDRSTTGFSEDAAYYSLLGMNAEGVRDPSTKVHVDVDSLINYMLVIFYTGNFDGPVSSFYDNQLPNNFVAITNRVDLDQGFVFFAHDNEHSLRVDAGYVNFGLEEDRVNIGTEDFGSGVMDVSDFRYFHPQWLHYRLTDNSLYRARFAARAQELLGMGGLMTANNSQTLFQSRADEIQWAIIAESARWGDAQTTGGFGGATGPHTKNGDWLSALDEIKTGFFGARTDIVIAQLEKAGLY